MAGHAWLRFGLGLSGGLGCGLLTPYPGGGNPADALAGSRPDNATPFDKGDEQAPLVDPAFDDSIRVSPNREPPIIAFAGESFSIDLTFIAPNENVVGGGIAFPGSDEIQWTFIDNLRGLPNGTILFGYAVERELCEGLSNLCHAIETRQFAVAANVAPDGDVDGDGEPDGDFVVSPPVEVSVVLQCATCDSQSCVDLLGEASCTQCGQPDVCQELYELCYAPGRPKAGTEEADQFETFFGINGIAWTNAAGCAAGPNACQEGLAAASECSVPPDMGESSG